MSQFKKFIEAGKNSADQVSKNIESVNAIFDQLNQELKEETDGKVTLERYRFNPASGLAAVAKRVASVLEPSVSLNSAEMGTLDVSYPDDIHSSVAKWEQHPDGFPFTIEFLRERTDCWDVDSLVNTLARIISSGQFWLKVRELESKFSAKKNHEENEG